ncbi:hypothetical protein KQR57_05275 [Bacillus inaquosorum]|nr:hypothetical protein [Bacillus inaquosorum]
MSPHQRLILQESWKALEDAGYNPKSLAEVPVGVFIGAEPANYYHESLQAHQMLLLPPAYLIILT